MLDFHRKKDSSILCTVTQKDNSFLHPEQSKTMYDYILKHDTQIKDIKSEIINLKTQLMELALKSSFTHNIKNNNTFINNNENSNLFLSQIKKFKNEIKNELMFVINDMVNSTLSKFQEEFEQLKEEMIINDGKINNKKISEINTSLENINQRLMNNNIEKTNLENYIIDKVKKDKIEINNSTENIIKRIDNLDMDFDRLIVSLKNQFLNSANTINQLQLSKVNLTEYEKQIEVINQSIRELNNKIDKNKINNDDTKINQDNNSIISNPRNNKEIISKEEVSDIKQQLKILKNDLYNDMENINLKMLNELKNQAIDIKQIYQEIYLLKNNNKINFNLGDKLQASQDFNSSNFYSSNTNFSNKNTNIPNNIISYIDSELSKKVNLDQLNFALETQAKLNEAFSSASRISRFCWDSEGTLKEDKYIKWSIQNINTALDVFKWEKNSENIKILQNGVYKIVFGLIGLDNNKNLGIIYNNNENIVMDSNTNINNNNTYESENYINNEKGNIQFMIKYIACIENTDIKAIIFNNKVNDSNFSNDNSEEAFLEIIKII